MITFIPKRPSMLKPSVEKPNAMHQLAFDRSYKEYCACFQRSFIKRNACYYQAYNWAANDALVVLSVYLSYACEGMLYGEV